MCKQAERITRRHFLAGTAATAGSAVVERLSGEMRRERAVQVNGSHSLREHAAAARLLFGFAVDVGTLLRNAAYREAVEAQCSIVVPDNAMKWDALAPSATQYNFETTDALLAFCERTRIKLRGHTLCWHGQLPAWFATTATTGNARELLLHHIQTVAGRYASRMHSWDVINEAVEPSDGRPDGLRNSVWLNLLGPEYIEIAFRAAREADPAALLTYNDYDLESETAGAVKRAAVLTLLRRLKQRNVPIDAVGLQSHLMAGERYGTGLQAFIDACRELDLQVFLSELDVNDHTVPGTVAERDRIVADTYRQYLATTLSAQNVTAVLTWGVSNANSWLSWAGQVRNDGRPLRPLLLDDKLQPAPAFLAVRSAFDSRARRSRGTGLQHPA